jgi:hypothetical protein
LDAIMKKKASTAVKPNMAGLMKELLDLRSELQAMLECGNAMLARFALEPVDEPPPPPPAENDDGEAEHGDPIISGAATNGETSTNSRWRL